MSDQEQDALTLALSQRERGPAGAYAGLLVIGDPHLEGRQPGFRKDDYPEVILTKLAWCLDFAAMNRLLPAILGDLFDKPRDNPNWLLARLLDLLRGEVLSLYGNHDCADPVLSDHDSLSLLVKSGRLRLVSAEHPWVGTLGGRAAVVGGSSYRQEIPAQYEPPTAAGSHPLVVWLAHHDVLIPGYDEGRIRPFEIAGVELLINGHIHRRLDEVRAGATRWLTPGNITRRSRNEACRAHAPAVLRIDVTAASYELAFVEVPHRPFDEVFHEVVADAPADGGASAFVAGLAELQARRTDSGAGLLPFLEQNLGQFQPAVAAEIMNLASEVLNHGQ
jgi:DNA repair exonuclease SbcCD nuclease subunit